MEDHDGAFQRIQMTDEWVIHSVVEAFELGNKLIEKGEEGIILKNPKGHWVNKRSKDWLKVKDKNTVDLVVKR
ncbi:hypothetical protein, partial [Winogradskyella poriferorum]|uniref:ATP-dependent DNA ligase n=1 Tax=Winogradskyella poriferorum TaxID=307627 RepID=UPI003D64A343